MQSLCSASTLKFRANGDCARGRIYAHLSIPLNYAPLVTMQGSAARTLGYHGGVSTAAYFDCDFEIKTKDRNSGRKCLVNCTGRMFIRNGKWKCDKHEYSHRRALKYFCQEYHQHACVSFTPAITDRTVFQETHRCCTICDKYDEVTESTRLRGR
jgi:hypothetical protein